MSSEKKSTSSSQTKESKRITKFKVEVPYIANQNEKWRGKAIFPDRRYFVCSILAKRRSGKTCLLYSLLKHFVTKNCIVLFFCASINKDPTYLALKDYLQSKGIPYQANSHFIEDEVNFIDAFMKKAEEADEDDEEKTEGSENGPKSDCQKMFEAQMSGMHPQEIAIELEKEQGDEKKPKKKQPTEYIICFDDLSSDLRHPSLQKLCKNSQHYRCKILMSSQAITDLHPAVHSQIDYCCLFGRFNKKSLSQIYERLQPPESPEVFEYVYKDTTSAPYQFLTIDRNQDHYRKGLEWEIEPASEDELP